ncbi:hypothetical protein GBF38_022935, partial [Nibea albiflora]
METESTEAPPGPTVSPTARRKSWRRATITRRSLPALPNLYQIEHMDKEWACLAKRIRSEPQGHHLPVNAARLQAESESWEALLNKHRSKAEEMERKVEQGQERGISLDTTSVARSSQYHFIQSKPDYRGLLCRQQPMLHTMTMIVC